MIDPMWGDRMMLHEPRWRTMPKARDPIYELIGPVIVRSEVVFTGSGMVDWRTTVVLPRVSR